MSLLDYNFSEVPDNFETLPADVYDLEITEVAKEPAKSGNGDNLIVHFAVVKGSESNDKFVGRKITHYIFLGNEMGLIRCKKFLKAAGADPKNGPVNTEELLGRICKAAVGTRTYKDNITGEERQSSEVKDYILAM